MSLTEKEIRQMIKIARATRSKAFAHRSGHKIGASVLTDTGEVFGGCNIESVISGLGSCAERTAIDHAITHGQYNVRAICTVDDGMTPMCGACLQYALLFSQMSDDEIFVVNADSKNHYNVTPLSTLLPQGYKTKSNLQQIKAYKNGKGKKKKRKKQKH
ncbi:cytidine deaminase [Candidatus Uhrbacteria bacterium]|nr:cytidine deaminase [Candidatus Uhrbacteria bacterium]